MPWHDNNTIKLENYTSIYKAIDTIDFQIAIKIITEMLIA